MGTCAKPDGSKVTAESLLFQDWGGERLLPLFFFSKIGILSSKSSKKSPPEGGFVRQ